MAAPRQTIHQRLLNGSVVRHGHRLWIGAVLTSGYGAFNNSTAHRAAYMEWVGPIPEGHDVHHVEECGIKLCIEPTHLTTMERREHRSLHQRLDEACGRGHLRSEHTTIKADGTRYCRACKRGER